MYRDGASRTCRTWFRSIYEEVKAGYVDECDKRRPPVDEEHGSNAVPRPQQTMPLAVHEDNGHVTITVCIYMYH
ncbi:hypothetical protein DPMN_013781 [Dreissena polymorpha]|uniref:Uncharacterized protein n=1 Tax=Dreissena polymorpha TaxID=45954 RepID=A0A9D4N9J4_DREPO|nr:hypothetical protein DPMN_013781 [Dreissena polymorpha]